MPEFAISHPPDFSPERLGSIVQQFLGVYGHLPTSARAHSLQVDKVRSGFAALGYNIPVETTGGTLLGELWLQYNDETRKGKDHA